MKRRTQTLLALLLACLLLATGALASDWSAYTPKEGERYTIEWVSSASSPTDEDGAMIQHWNEVFGVDIKIVNVDSNQYEELMNLKFASDDVPDRFSAYNTATFTRWANQDLLAEIPEALVAELTPTLYAMLLDMDPSYFNLTKIDGVNYGMRTIHGPQEYRSALVWRTDWLQNVGIDKLPETLEEAEAAFYAFRNDDPDGNGEKDTYALSQQGFTAIWGAYGLNYGSTITGPTWLEEDGALIHSVVHPDMKVALGKLAQWYADELIDPEFITSENKGGYWGISHAFVGGRIGMTNHANYYHWLPAQFEGGYQGLNITEFLKVYGEDSLDKIGYGVPMAVEGKNSGLPQGNVITNGAKLFGAHLEDEPDKMGKMLQMIEGLETSLEMFQTAYMGFEGVSWEYNSEGAPVYIEPYNDVSELSAIGAQETMMSFDFPEFRWQTTEFGQQPWALSLGLDKGGLRANIMLPLETEAKYKADLDKLEEEMLVKIITGEEPLDYFDAFVEQWYNLGGREMTEEATRKLAEQRGL